MSDSLNLLVLDALTKARELIAKPERWTTRCAAREASPGKGLLGVHVDPTHAAAACWCSIGALRKVAADMYGGKVDYWSQFAYPAYAASIQALEKIIAPTAPAHQATEVIAGFNDAEDTKHADVLAVFDKAIALAKGTV